MREQPVTAGGARAWAYFEKEFGRVCDELAFAIREAERAEPELFNSNSDTASIMASVRWVFSCEWDDDIDHWWMENYA